MSQNHAEVSYSCGSCGYPLHLKSSNRITSAIGSEYPKSIKRGLISFRSIDISRFTQVDQVGCIPFTCIHLRSKTKLLCRKCACPIGYGYRDSSSFGYRKFTIKIRALQPSEE